MKRTKLLLVMMLCLLLTGCGKDGQTAKLCQNIADKNNADAMAIIEKMEDVNVAVQISKIRCDSEIYNHGQWGEKTTPLATACAVGNEDMIDALLKAGADPSLEYEEENTYYPLELFCESGYKAGNVALISLIDAGADVNKSRGVEPVFRLASKLSTASTEYTDLCDYILILIDSGANWTSKSFEYEGDTLLHIAAAQTIDSPLEELLEYEEGKEFINSQDSYGNTPLMEAVKSDNYENVVVLLAHGADDTIVNSDGMTAEKISQLLGNVAMNDVFNMLKKSNFYE